MAYWRYGSKQDEYNFFSEAFQVIDEHHKSSFFYSKCSPVYKELASKSSDGRIQNWNEIPLNEIRGRGFAGYQQALETIFKYFESIYKSTEYEETCERIEQLMEQAVAVMRGRISDVERGGILREGHNGEVANHLNVIILWSRCLMIYTQRISRLKYHQESRIFGMSVPGFFCVFVLFIMGASLNNPVLVLLALALFVYMQGPLSRSSSNQDRQSQRNEPRYGM